MRVAIVHYHLEPGGVTRVIENTLESFSQELESPQFVVLTGRKYPGNKIKNVQIVEGLDYSSPTNSISPSVLKERLEKAAKVGLGGKPDIWHIHNHSLGKNASLTKAVALLAEDANPMLLHPHDFAEDGRPSNFSALKEIYSSAYPSSSTIHYATLNHRDHTFLKKVFSTKASPVHLLANAISIPSAAQEVNTLPPPELPDNLFLYPVRAVRRKNLGELALIAASYPEKHFANSLGPTNPEFQPIFKRWEQFSNEINLPVTFALGEKTSVSFPEMVDHADGILSTSIAEGFGLGFLEPWMSGKFLWGRNIPEITLDFSSLGINLNHLYQRININLEHLQNKGSLTSKIQTTLENFFLEYQQEMPSNATDIAYQSMVQNDQVDFGRLDEVLQEEIILSISKSTVARDEIRSQVKLERIDPEIILKNKESINENFAPKSYTTKLKHIYEKILDSKRDQFEFAQGEHLLDSFLSPARLNLLRT